MSELKAYRFVLATETSSLGRVVYNSNYVYAKDDVDELIAKKDAEIARLKAPTPNEVMKEVFDKVLIYPKEMVRLDDAYKLAVALRDTRRALWSARANMARGLAEMCEHQMDCCGVSRSRFLIGWDKRFKPKRMTTTEWGKLWRKVEQKCWAKAEEVAKYGV